MRIAVTPSAAAARARRRLAVRSSTAGSPGSAITTPPSAGQRSPSTAARSTAVASGRAATISRPGSSPIAASPAGQSIPDRRQPASSPSQRRSPPISRASSAAKPDALAQSARSASSSCRRPRASPPPSARSIPAWPVATTGAAGSPAGRQPRSTRARLSLARRSDSDIGPGMCSTFVLLRAFRQRDGRTHHGHRRWHGCAPSLPLDCLNSP